MSRRDEPALWRLFDATVRAEYERRLTLAKQQIGPLPTTPGFRADPGHLAVLAAQRVDARALAAGADARGWSTGADRHRRLAERLDALIAQAQAG
jgi:hypothetical protein